MRWNMIIQYTIDTRPTWRHSQQNKTEEAVNVWEDHEEKVGVLILTVYLLPVLSPGWVETLDEVGGVTQEHGVTSGATGHREGQQRSFMAEYLVWCDPDTWRNKWRHWASEGSTGVTYGRMFSLVWPRYVAEQVAPLDIGRVNRGVTLWQNV